MQRVSWGTGMEAEPEAGVRAPRSPGGHVKEMVENGDGARGRGRAWVGFWESFAFRWSVQPKGLGRIIKVEVFLPCENVFRTLSNCPKVTKV